MYIFNLFSLLGNLLLKCSVRFFLVVYYMLYSGNKVFSSPFESSSKKKRKDIDRFIPHSVSKNLYTLF